MAVQVIPLQSVPSQTVAVQLGAQPCVVTVTQTPYGLFLTLYVGTTLIVASALCLNLNPTVRMAYTGFLGELTFMDTQGNSNPVYTGLGGAGARYQLLYVPAEDLGAVVN